MSKLEFRVVSQEVRRYFCHAIPDFICGLRGPEEITPIGAAT